MDLRQWIGLLEREGELHRITAPVSWDREIGTIARKVLERKGPALLFENIRGYQNARGRRVFTGGIGSRSHWASRRTPVTTRSSSM
jgi:4-hydroxy-3-polyprenylbenzoate decarboxylase